MCVAKFRQVCGHIMNGGIRESDMNELRGEVCCLCCSSILKDSRKRFHGTSCKKAKAILANLTIASPSVSLEDVVELSDHNTILCNGCKRLLDIISKLEVKLQTLQS